MFSVAAVDLIEPLDPVNVPGRAGPPATQGWHNAIDATERQDAVWYLRLADEGWSTDDASAAFFPLYPLTVRAVALIFPDSWPGDELLAALLVSNLAFLGALLALFALTAEAFGDRVARRAIVVAAIFPTAFFFLAPYTESLFLLLSILAFREARHDRWGRVAVFGALAALTRSVGILLVPALMLEAIWAGRASGGGRRRRPRTAHWPARPRSPSALCPGSLGGVSFTATGWRRWMRRGIGAERSNLPWVSLGHAVEFAWTYQSYWLLDLVIVSLAIGGLALALPALRPSEAVYGAFSLAASSPGSVRGQAAALRPSFRGGGVPRAVGPLRGRARPEAARAARDLRARGRLGDLRSPVPQLAAPVLNRACLLNRQRGPG